MAKLVAKFGGTSVKTAQAIRQVTQIIKDNTDIQAIVVSAVGGVTNLLVEICNNHLEERNNLIHQILSIHLSLAQELELSIDAEINKKITILERLASSKEIVPAVADQILSTGEDLSSMIVHTFLLSQHINIELVDIRNYLVTNDNFGKAIPRLDIIKIRTASLPQTRFITQGFIGSTSEGNTTTLGRGGSDYSAALLAEAISADELYIYTDVAGVYTIDPNLTKDALLVKEIGFQEMADIANFGAKVLHPATVEPCIRAHVPVRILSTFSPNSPGTFITPQTNQTTPSLKTFVTIRKNQSLVTIKRTITSPTTTFFVLLFKILAKYKINTDLINITENSVAIVIDTVSMSSQGTNPFLYNESLLSEIKQFAEITIENKLSLVSVINNTSQHYCLPSSALQYIPNTIRFISYGAMTSITCLLVSTDIAIKVAISIHQAILNQS